jgi:mono/diheme cytochrome c family protein
MRSIQVSILALCGGLSLSACRGGDSEQPPVHLIHNMDTQEKGKAYRRDTSGLFADGRVMRAPVEGTVAQGELDDDDVLYEGVNEKKEPTKAFPDAVKTDGKIPDSLADRGHLRYNIYCTPCHGAEGDGHGAVAGLALDGGPRLLVPPPAFTSERLMGMVAGQLYSAIKNGVNAGNMPSYASQIPVADRWAIIAYVRRDLQKMDYEGGEGIKVVNVTSASAANGALLYKAKGCNACHSIDGTRIVGPSLKGIYGTIASTSAGDVTVDDAYLKESYLNPMAKIVTGYPPAMPPQVLKDLEIQSLSLFIASIK